MHASMRLDTGVVVRCNRYRAAPFACQEHPFGPVVGVAPCAMSEALSALAPLLLSMRSGILDPPDLLHGPRAYQREPGRSARRSLRTRRPAERARARRLGRILGRTPLSKDETPLLMRG